MPGIRSSVCIPVFNRKDEIGAAVRSALAQDIEGLEVIVVDNHSDDGTWETLQLFSDDRLRLYRNEKNIGMFGNFNRCSALAQGDYVLFLCSDDQLCEGFMSHAVSQLDACPQAALLSSLGRYRRGDGVLLGWAGDLAPAGVYEGASVGPAFFWALGSYGTNLFNYPSGVVIRRSVLAAGLEFRSEVGHPADVDLFLRCLSGGDLLRSDRVGCLIADGPGQAGSQGKKMGRHLLELSRLAKLHLADPEHAMLLRHFRRLMGAGVMGWFVRQTLSGNLHAVRQSKAFGYGLSDVIMGFLLRARHIFGKWLGYRPVPYLRRRP